MKRSNKKRFIPIDDRGPLKVMFALTSMPVGGAETLLVNLIRGLDRNRFRPEVCCLKEKGPLGEVLATEVPVHSQLISGKYDLRVWRRLAQLMYQRRIDALVTVGAGDKMFWGRLAAWRARVPVVLSALHSTGWPDGIGKLNRMLTMLTDGFIGVASEHGRHLIENEKLPPEKVFVIPNGVDVQRFRPQPEQRRLIRDSLGIAQDAPVVGIVAALRPEKNHRLFLRAATMLRRELPDAQFLIVGDGPERRGLELAVTEADIQSSVHFLGTRSDIPELLAAIDLFSLTSHNEANPVSILEAMATGLPVVATRVGSVAESVADGETGFLVNPGDLNAISERWQSLLTTKALASQFGDAGREVVVKRWSLERMIEGYQDLIANVYMGKCPSDKAQSRDGRSETDAVDKAVTTAK